MKKLLIILLAILFASCNPFMPKALREKNKCNRKVEKELKRHKRKSEKINLKCPGTLVQDTIRDTLVVEIPKVEIDSFLIIEKDTAEIDSLVGLIKNRKTREIIRKYITEYVPIKDTVIHLTDGYTIKFWSKDGKINYTVDKPLKVIKKVSEKVVQSLKQKKLTLLERIINGLYKFWWVVLLIFICILLIFKAKRTFFTKK